MHPYPLRERLEDGLHFADRLRAPTPAVAAPAVFRAGGVWLRPGLLAQALRAEVASVYSIMISLEFLIFLFWVRVF